MNILLIIFRFVLRLFTKPLVIESAKPTLPNNTPSIENKPPLIEVVKAKEKPTAIKPSISNLSNDLKHKILTVISVFETGRKTFDYGKLTILPDAPNNKKQITWGKLQTTQSSGLKQLLEAYDKKEGRKISFGKYLSIANKLELVNDEHFLQLLNESAKDPIMQQTQDEFFDSYYFAPAKQWALQNGFTLPLSMLVILDSFIHSGGMRNFLINRFSEERPINGGNEKKWIENYVLERELWLMERSKLLAKTIYRTNCFQDCMLKNNWYLDLPVISNGVKVN